MKLKMKMENDINVGRDQSYLECVFDLHDIGVEYYIRHTLYKFYRLQLYCMIVIVYRCGIQLPMRYQMFFTCFFYGCGIKTI